MKMKCFTCKKIKYGMSLPEVLIAVFVFTLVLSSSIKALKNVDDVYKRSEELSIANQVLGTVIEQISNFRDTGGWDFVVSGMKFDSSNVSLITSLGTPSVSVNVNYYKDEFGADIDTLKQISVTLTWISYIGRTQTKSLVTILSKPPE